MLILGVGLYLTVAVVLLLLFGPPISRFLSADADLEWPEEAVIGMLILVAAAGWPIALSSLGIGLLGKLVYALVEHRP